MSASTGWNIAVAGGVYQVLRNADKTPDDHARRPPLAGRLPIRLASWLVPRRTRAEWLARWNSGLYNWWILVERGEITRDTEPEVIRHCWGAFKDAFWQRFRREHLRRQLRGPGIVLASGALILLLAALLTSGFSATRALFLPLMVNDPKSLVTLRFTGSADQPSGVPPVLVPAWRAKSKYLADLAGYRHLRRANRAMVTTNFFSLMGTPAALGRTFEPGDTSVAVLSGPAWQQAFGADPGVIGRTISLDGRQYTVVGVLPEAFWAISPKIAIWTPLTLEPAPEPGTPFLIGAVGRVKPGTSEAALRAELLEIAKTVGFNLPRPPQVVRFDAVPGRMIGDYAAVVGFAVVIAATLVAVGRLSLRRHGWKYWAFFGAKTVWLLTVLPLLWIEIGAALRTQLPDTPWRAILAGPIFSTVFILGLACALWWNFADQNRRCPVCLQKLALPVTIGSWASTFEPATTELLCVEGHGSLAVPETESGEPDRWTALDASWRELFKK